MQVQVKLFAYLRDVAPPGAEGGAFQVQVEENTKVAGILERCQLAPQNVLVLVNGLVSVGEQVLVEGDVVSIFPPLGGG